MPGIFLVALPQEASPEDTLKAWKKAIDIRERIIKGEPFERWHEELPMINL